MMERICELVTDSHIEEDFKKFVEHMGKHDKTWKFWAQFFSLIALVILLCT